ncbi:MAG: ASCH domain-containing protein [Parcubacteria group bacterium]|nr:ASCH domain-containing protein [Parcubacteria group bacterium]
MKSLKFQPHFVKEILEGRKTTTWRLFDDKDLKVGDKLEFLNAETLEKFAEAEIIDIKKKRLGEIENSDYEGQRKFDSQEEMLKHYKTIYGDKVDLDTEVKIVKFRLFNV